MSAIIEPIHQDSAVPDLTDGKVRVDLQIVDAAAGPDHLDGEIGRVLQARRNGCRP